MSEETKYITKIIKTEETTTGDGGKVGVEVEYFVKDSEARESISDLNRDVYDINQTLGDFSSQENFESVKSEINRVNNKIGDLGEIANKPTSGDNTIVNNINNLGNNINNLEDTITEYVESEINDINSKIGDLEEITTKPAEGDNTIVNNINELHNRQVSGDQGIYYYLNNTLKPGLESKISTVSTNLENIAQAISDEIDNLEEGTIGYLKDITNGENKSIVENINRLDTRIDDVNDRISDINDNLSDELSDKISGIILDRTGKVYNNLNKDGVVNISDEIIIPTINISYNDLVDLRDNGFLVPGQKYRITDYVTKAFYSLEYDSAEHPFDIIVEALSKNTLSEDAKAINHEYVVNPEDDYFRNCNLSAWELKYCLDNDTTRFDWATNYGFDSSSYDFQGGIATVGVRHYIIFEDSYIKNYDPEGMILTPCDRKTDPDGKENQLCLSFVTKDYTDYYFYYGYARLNETGIEDDRYNNYWRKAEYKGDSLEWENVLVTTAPITSKEGYMEQFCMSRLIIKEPKGVIYYMKDEWGNEAPFDFKNIRLYRSVFFYADPEEQNNKLFDKYLYNRVDQKPPAPQQTNVFNMDGYWYLFSGLYVEQRSDNPNSVIFCDKLPFHNVGDIINSANITDYVVDLSVVNNHKACVQNNIIKQRDFFDTSNDVDLFSHHITVLPLNIFIALVDNAMDASKVVIYNNTVGLCSDVNLFTVGPTKVTDLLGNTINAECYRNYIISSSYCDLKPKTNGEIKTTI